MPDGPDESGLGPAPKQEPVQAGKPADRTTDQSGGEIADFALRLDRVAAAVGTGPVSADGAAKPNSALGIALRLSTELVLGLLVGGVLGWLLDRWLGSGPWLMIVFLFCGMGAGMKNVVMTAGAMNKAASDPGSGDGRE